MNKLLLCSAAVLVTMPRAFNNEGCPTVTIETDNGPVRINKSEYDANPDNYILASDQEVKSSAAPVGAAKTAAPEKVKPLSQDANEAGGKSPMDEAIETRNFGVLPDGKKFYVVDKAAPMVKGKPARVVDMAEVGINPKGYDDSQTAWDAVFKLKARNTSANAPAAGNNASTDAPQGGGDPGDNGNASQGAGDNGGDGE